MITRMSDNYLKVVEWSEQDQCYVGTAPGLMIGGVHGKNEERVFRDLCAAVEDVIATLQKNGKPLPPETASKKYSGKIALRIPSDLHKRIAIKATQNGQSINTFICNSLAKNA